MKYKSYNEAHALSLSNPEAFWGREADKLHWYKKPDKILDDSNYPFFKLIFTTLFPSFANSSNNDWMIETFLMNVSNLSSYPFFEIVDLH